MTTTDPDTTGSTPRAIRQAISAGVLGGAPLPADGRAALEETVVRLLAETPTRDGYAIAWNSENATTPLSDEVRKQIDAVEIPVEDLCLRGVAALSDRELVSLAARPLTLELLAEFILDGYGTANLGLVWRAPLERAARDAYPDEPPDAAEKTSETIGTSANYVAPSGPQPARRRYSDRVMWAAVAAALVLGVGLGIGGRGLFTKDETNDRWAALSSGSAVGRLQPRGGDVAFELKLESPRDGFATVIVPRAGDRPRVYPEGWDDPPRVTPGAAGSYGPLDARAGQSVLVVVTETPAADVLRRAFEKLPPGSSDDAIKAHAEAALKANGFHWAAFARIELK